MNFIRSTLLTAALALATVPLASAQSPRMAPSPNQGSTFIGLDGQLVGLWHFDAQIGPCGGPAQPAVSSTSVFHAGGTLAETNTMPLGGIPNILGIPGMHVRGPAFGTWRYDWRHRRYVAQMRFNWYVSGIYHGYQQIQRELRLTDHARQADGAITSTRYLADGSPLADFCGHEHGERI